MTNTKRAWSAGFYSILKTVIWFLFLIFIALNFPSCVHDPFLSEDPSVTDTIPDTVVVTTCDTMQVSFRKNIQPIFNQCISCHGPIINNSGLRLHTYQGVIEALNTGRLLGAIRWENGFIRMPLDLPQLVGCDIKKIEIWVKNGAMDN